MSSNEMNFQWFLSKEGVRVFYNFNEGAELKIDVLKKLIPNILIDKIFQNTIDCYGRFVPSQDILQMTVNGRTLDIVYKNSYRFGVIYVLSPFGETDQYSTQAERERKRQRERGLEAVKKDFYSLLQTLLR